MVTEILCQILYCNGQKLKEPEKVTVVILITFFILGVGLYSVEPIMTQYVSALSPNASHIALISGLVFSATGLSNIISAPRLGRLSDKIGA